MSALLWWLIPIGATLLALGWAAMRSRPRRTVDTHESVTGMMRFTEAMRRPLPDGEPGDVTPMDMNQLGAMLQQLGQLLQGGGSQGPVNWDLARD
ncbi:MAG: hypothetical protein ACKOT0_13615, partial [bacterium]